MPETHLLALLLSTQLASNVPYLDLEGTKWALFAMRFRKAMIASDRWGHFDGTDPCPVAQDPANPTAEEQKEIQRWTREDRIAEYLLDQCLHKKTALDIEACATTKDRWDMIKRKFMAKSEYAKANLYQSFLDMKCLKGGDICEFLNDLSTKRHELKAIGITVTCHGSPLIFDLVLGLPSHVHKVTCTVTCIVT